MAEKHCPECGALLGQGRGEVLGDNGVSELRRRRYYCPSCRASFKSTVEIRESPLVPVRRSTPKKSCA